MDEALGSSATQQVVVTPSVPVLYFGNLQAFRASPLQVVTVGLNPSHHEFPPASPFRRFAAAEPGSAPRPSPQQHAEALDSYFEQTPLARWFNRLEPLLESLGASFYAGQANRALHSDLESPLATNPTWSRLTTKAQEELVRGGVPLWHDLARFLEPTVVLGSFADHYRREIAFDWDGAWTLTWLASGKKLVEHRWLTWPSGKCGLLVYGAGGRHPFGNLTRAQKVALGQRVREVLNARTEGREAEPPSALLPAPVLPLPSVRPGASRPRPMPKGDLETGGTAARPVLCDGLPELVDQLSAWVEDNEHASENLRLDGKLGSGGGGAHPRVGFYVEGFEAGDFRDDGKKPALTGLDFNSTFVLASDTQKKAVERFLACYDEWGDQPGLIFECARSKGKGKGPKLVLRPYIAGWQCLAGERRLQQLLRRLQKET